MKKLTLNQVLMESLKDPKEAAAYLDVALEEKDIDAFLHALRTVAEAQGGMSAIARKTRLNRAGLYRMFTSEGNPSFRNVARVVGSLGYKIRFERQTARLGTRAAGK
jgi:probable addiction module antidote protein